MGLATNTVTRKAALTLLLRGVLRSLHSEMALAQLGCVSSQCCILKTLLVSLFSVLLLQCEFLTF